MNQDRIEFAKARATLALLAAHPVPWDEDQQWLENLWRLDADLGLQRKRIGIAEYKCRIRTGTD